MNATALVRGLLIAQAAGAVLALIALSAFTLLVLAFGAFGIAFLALLGCAGLAAAIILALVGQARLKRDGSRWWWAMAGLEVVVIAAGAALEGYLLLPTQAGQPAPPTMNVVLVLVVPALAALNLVLMIATRRSMVHS